MSSLSSPRPLSRLRYAGLLLAIASGVFGAACASEVASQEPGGASAADPQILATVDGEEITVDDLRDFVGDELDQLEFQYRSQRHKLLESGLESALRERLLEAEATARGVSVDELVAAEVGEIEINEAQVAAFYETNRARLQGRALEELRPAIRQFLTDQRREERVAALADELAAARSVERRLDPFRVELETEGHPTLGPEDAPVTLVEFSDFECPYCRGFYDTLNRIKVDYGDRVRIVYRQFPLRQIHPNAQKAAEASLCAADQGKFWELHDLMFEEQHSLDVAALEDKAERLGLDIATFETCLSSGTYAEQVQEDLEAGARLGVTGTPALFVNGRPVEGGAVPYETIAPIIDDELERRGR